MRSASAIAATLLILSAGPARSGPARSGPARSGPVNQFVEPKVCATCHPDIAAKYARTGMGRSFFKPTAANTVENYANASDHYHALSDSHYSMTIRNGRYFQRRWQIGLDGKEINAEELKIDYVIGSGNHGRFYLHRTEQGLLLELPLGWYPENGGEWGLVPGSDLPQPHTRTFISYKCMACHNAYPAIPPGNEATGSDPVFSGDLPEGIDCQRCHGPGGEHARSSGRIAILNPATLSPARRMEVCMQCHLETTLGNIPAKLQRLDRGPFSYVAGQPLAEFATFFDYAPGTRENRFEGLSGLYRLRKSRCYLESSGKLECTSCHDPHDTPPAVDAVRHYSAVCLQCHASKHKEAITATAADCITCHMPKRRAEDAPHMIMTDHLIQRRAPANALADFAERPAEPYYGEVVPYYPWPPPQTPQDALYRAVAQVGMGNNLAAGMPELVRWIDQLRPPEAEFYMILGDGWKSLGKQAEAAAAYRRALQREPNSVRAMRALAEVEPETAVSTLARAVELAPGDAQSWFQYGVLTASPERIQKAISLNPWLPDQSRSLAELTHSESALEDALRTDPFDDAAWDIGGRIMAEKGDFRQASFDFERAIRIHPQGRYRYDYAVALVRADRFDEAQTQAQLAAQSDPTLFEAHELLGAIYTFRNKLPDAAGEYRAALALRPDLARVHLRLGIVLASLGDRDAAATHLRAAASGNDADVARQAAQTLRDQPGR